MILLINNNLYIFIKKHKETEDSKFNYPSNINNFSIMFNQ